MVGFHVFRGYFGNFMGVWSFFKVLSVSVII